jgi:hypothetical protein
LVLKKNSVMAVLVTLCLIGSLFMVIPINSSPGVGDYDPWADYNDDGVIDGNDLIVLARKYGSNGTPIIKAGLLYDSGWVNIADQAGQYYTLVHNLNLNSTEVIVDARGRALGWNKTYGGTNNDEICSLIQTNDGGFALAGGTNSTGEGEVDFFLIKIDANGNMQWNQTYGGVSSDQVWSVVQTKDGGYALAGYTWSFGVEGCDAWLVKTDENGTVEWNQTYGGWLDDFAFSVVQTDDGGYALAGGTSSSGAGYTDFWLVKANATGAMEWNKTYGDLLDDVAYSMIQTKDGGYALAGETIRYGGSIPDFWLVKTNATGVMEWNKTYGGPQDDYATCVIQTIDGGYALAGATYSFGAVSGDFWLVKADANGDAKWNKTYGGTREDVAYSVIQADDGGYAVAGYTQSFGAGNADFWLVKTDENGKMFWNRTYGGTEEDVAYSMIQTRDKGYALAGYTYSFGAGYMDCWLVKTEIEAGLGWTNFTVNSVTLYRETPDNYWNFVRVCLWKPR